jgi:hypothetical protein
MIFPANPDDLYFGGVSHPPTPPSSFVPVSTTKRLQLYFVVFFVLRNTRKLSENFAKQNIPPSIYFLSLVRYVMSLGPWLSLYQYGLAKLLVILQAIIQVTTANVNIESQHA